MFLLLTSLIGNANASDFEDYLAQKYPDPATATVLSSSIGFGAGHFYSKRYAAGTTHLMAQAGGLTILGIGSARVINALGDTKVISPSIDYSISDIESNSTDLEYDVRFNSQELGQGLTMIGVGLSSYLVARMIDTVTAPTSAKRRARRLMERDK